MHAAQPLDTAPAPATATSMRAALRRRYGEPDVLSIGEVAVPTPGDDEVLVRVSAASVNIGDHHMVTGRPYLIRLSPYGGLPGPKRLVPGACMAGRVVSVGAKVTAYRVGDEVMGQALSGAFAEYVALPASHLALKPESLSFEEAAAVPWGATALKGLRDAGGLTAGQRVLINGASGAVGSWAVQIAKALGAVVTAVCSTRNVERVRALGADEVIDYTREDFTVGGRRFDVVFDTVGNRSLSEFRSVLQARGVFVACAGGGGDWLGPLVGLLELVVTSLFVSQRLVPFVMTPDAALLATLKELVEAGKVKPLLDRRYTLDEVADALRHVGEGHAQGQTVLTLAG